MKKNQFDLNIQCDTCSISTAWMTSQPTLEATEIINTLVKKISILDIGEHIYHQNENMKNIFVLNSGCCKEYALDEDGNEKINHFYLPGDILALESMASKKYIFSVMALQQSQIYIIPCETLFHSMQKSPILLRQFSYMISHRIQHYSDIPMTTNAKQRIAAFLIMIFDKLQVYPLDKEQDYFSLPMSQFDIANFLGLAHETVSRVFHLFQKNLLLKITNKKIYITDIQLLKSIAHNRESLHKTKMTL